MIIKLQYNEPGLQSVKTVYNKKTKTHYMRWVVDEYSLENAIKEAESNKFVLALDYEGDLNKLWFLDEIPKIPVIISRQLDYLNEIELGFILKQVPEWVRVIVKLSSDFSDMRMIKQLSQMFPNVRFCGGFLLRLSGCNIGCIGFNDLRGGKVSEQKISYSIQGCGCAVQTMLEDSVEGLERIYKEVQEQQRIEKKKIVKNLADLIGK